MRRSFVLYLALLSMVPGVPVVLAQASPSSSTQSDRSRSIQPEAWQIVQLANQARAAAGAAPLKWDWALAAGARQHCLRMAADLGHVHAGRIEQRGEPRERDQPTAAIAPPAAVAVDPICGMTVAAVAGTVSLEHAGTTVYFCCEGCRSQFEARRQHAGAGA